MRHLLIDLETAPLPNVATFLDPVEAAKNLVDPVKIKADIERKRQDQFADAGLDWNLNRIVCAGLWNGYDSVPWMFTATTEHDEQDVLLAIAGHLRANPRPLILGFCVRRFDVPVLLQRARYLGVSMPRISLRRYDNPHIVDLYDLLTFDEQPCTSVMRRTLPSFCRRFGIEVEDDISGKDIAAMVEAGDWDGIAAHCRADIQRTRLLAERLGILQPQLAEEEEPVL